jgi:hypothetical protein
MDIAAFDKTVQHFVSLQKRYVTQHYGRECEHVNLALQGLRALRFQSDHDVVQVVRCKDCDRYFADGKYCCWFGATDCDPMGYCSKGIVRWE